jgi:hypothetical protein
MELLILLNLLLSTRPVKAMDLVIFHYHMLPGGVGTVVRRAVEALAAHPGPVRKIRLVTGRIAERDRTALQRFAEIDLVPEVDYDEGGNRGGRAWVREAEELSASLVRRFGEGAPVWWIHNFHLGRNLRFTRAILSLAQSADSPLMILQPHDFPEAGRYANLADLDRLIRLPLYPVTPRVRYALLNPRDFAILKKAGIPEENLFLLENPAPAVLERPPRKRRKRDLKQRLFGEANADLPVLLYPVRAIRRKNVLEAGLIARISETPARMLVTLPGVSRPERRYSALVESAFGSGLVPGEFAAGLARPGTSLETLAYSSDMVLSSSIQEGFGYFFIQAVQWGLPLLARRLDTTDGFTDVFKGYPASFYAEVLCPVDSRRRSRHLSLYRDKLTRLAKLFPAAALERLEGEIEGVFGGGPVDFSYLDAGAQLAILRDASTSQSMRWELRECNRELVSELKAMLAERPGPEAGRIEKRFGPAAYAARIHRLLSSFSRRGTRETGVNADSIGRRVREEFAKKEYLRLLYD